MSEFGDALEFVLTTREGPGGAEVGGTQLLGLLGEHLQLVAVAMLLATLLALPLGLWLGHTGRGTFLAVGVANVGRAVPSIAILFLAFAYLGAGFANVTLALVLLAVPPILTNAHAGVRAVDPELVDAARGQGLTGAQVVRQVELPLALPLVFGGLRTSTVNVVATATIAPFAGVVTLGDPIINPSAYGEAGRLGAAIVVAVLAVATELVLGAVQRAVTPEGITPTRRNRRMRRTLTAGAALLTALVLAGCGGDDGDSGAGSASETPAATTSTTSAQAIQRNAENQQVTLTVGSKNFTEQKVLGEVYAQALEAAGYTVRRELSLGDEQTALKALRGGQISGYPEYTGTALLSFLDTPAGELPTDPGEAYEQVKAGLAEDGITAFAPTPFTSSNEVGLLRSKAEELGVRTISDLAGKRGLKLYGSPECRTRRDCLLGLRQVYGLDDLDFTPIDIDQRHEVLTNGDADLSIVFTTDPQIKRNDEVLLEDDKGMFPPYNSTFLVTEETARKAGPDLQATIERVNRQLTDEVMQELNARVDLDKETPEQAARAYLRQFGLVAG